MTSTDRWDTGLAQHIDWLMEGDPSIRWQTLRDLCDAPRQKWQRERERVATTGWGAQLLGLRDEAGTWGGGIYAPKWISTTYTLLELRELGLANDVKPAGESALLITDRLLGEAGSAHFERRLPQLDYCISGFIVSLLARFAPRDERLDLIVAQHVRAQMTDGGWNCAGQFKCGARHGSFHTTFNVLDGLRNCLEKDLTTHRKEMERAEKRALEFMLQHRLYRSDKTGEIISPRFMLFSYPVRWFYDVLRGLDYFQRANAPRDKRLSDAIELLEKKRRKDGTWTVQNRHPGKAFFEMEKPGQPSRWNTLRALRVLKWWYAEQGVGSGE